MSAMSNVKKLTITAMLIALCVLLPIPFPREVGMVVLPMHIPILLAGLICGWKFGLLAGVVGPILSHVLASHPPASALAYFLSFELGMYGLVSGLVMHFIRTKRASLDLYIALVAAMLVGRIAAGALQVFFLGDFVMGSFTGEGFTWSMWVTVYFVSAIPGLIIQLAFLPSVVMALERERVIPLRYPIESVRLA
ncbi:MAG: ECF transporter S component [Defluviitaleaceae bacterium]|nr:ECF transporter S component [Defluviitaleaceae bacterium]